MSRHSTDDPASTVSSALDSLRQPEYVGENRCIPCTVVNAAIAVVLGAGLAAGAWTTGVGAAVAASAGTAVVVVAAGVIYLRGYLVPYTPTLTKRYLPDRVLRWFDKEPAPDLPRDDEDLVDVERALQDLGVVEECEDVDDLCLADSFRADWYDRIDRLNDEETQQDTIASLLDVDDPERVHVQRYGDAALVHLDGRKAGQWESDAALVADVAADQVLREQYPSWADVDVINRSRILNVLRMFVEHCPSCGAPVTVDQEVVESCCRTMDVAAVTCDRCESRVFEIELTEDLKANL